MVEGEIPHVPLVAHSIYTFHPFSLPNEYVSQDSSNSRWDVIEIDRRREKKRREIDGKKEEARPYRGGWRGPMITWGMVIEGNPFSRSC